MEWLLIVLAGGGAALLGRAVVGRRRTRQVPQDELDAVLRLADEDATLLGERLRRLRSEVRDLGGDARLDYERALDAYESARRELPRLQRADEIGRVTEMLSTGGYALACAHARIEARPRPERRVPCFFDPQHGPSAGDILWTRPRHGTRTVPACAHDAARVVAHEAPAVRTVAAGGRTMPYWEAGAAGVHYGRGYFVTAAEATGGLALDWAFSPPAEPTRRRFYERGWAPGDFSGIDHVVRGDLAAIRRGPASVARPHKGRRRSEL